jgi:hypothetical protein
LVIVSSVVLVIIAGLATGLTLGLTKTWDCTYRSRISILDDGKCTMYIIHKKYFQYRQYNADTKTSQTSHGQPLQHQYACSPDLPFGSFIV